MRAGTGQWTVTTWDRTDRALARDHRLFGAGPGGRSGCSCRSELRERCHRRVHRAGRSRHSATLTTDDAAIFFNFRPDRARQLSQRLLEGGFDLTTMTRYRDDLACPIAFAEQNIEGTVAEVVAAQGLRQLHIAETEKYARVTYFLNGGRERDFGGGVRVLVPSPKDVLATYDLKPRDVRSRGDETLRGGDQGQAGIAS